MVICAIDVLASVIFFLFGWLTVFGAMFRLLGIILMVYNAKNIKEVTPILIRRNQLRDATSCYRIYRT